MTASSDLYKLADGLAALPESSMARMVDEARRIVDANAPWPRMKGKKRAGLPVTMSKAERVETTAGGATFRVQGTVPGWLWANTGTRGHTIPRRHGGKLHRLTVQHPGMSGRHAWARVGAQLAKALPQFVDDELGRVVR